MRPASTVKHLFDLIPLASQEWRDTIDYQLVSILKTDICENELDKLQTTEYIALRSLHGVNGYPFDEVSSAAPEQSQLAMKSSSVLACEMQMYKYSYLYHYDVDFGKQVLVERLRLLFDKDDKSYKVLVKVIAPSDTDGEEIVYKRVFDESLYSQVTEKAHKQDVKEYFSASGLSAIVINFPSGYLGRYIRLQVELLDTHKSVYKL